jgi:hypothetical protein
LSKKIKMKCVYNYKFKKWTPIAREWTNNKCQISPLNLYFILFL